MKMRRKRTPPGAPSSTQTYSPLQRGLALITAPTAAEFQDPEEFCSAAVLSVSGEPQLGILSLAAVLEQRGDPCQIINLNRLFFDHVSATVEIAFYWLSAPGRVSCSGN